MSNKGCSIKGLDISEISAYLFNASQYSEINAYFANQTTMT